MDTKICSQCFKEKPIGEFYKAKTHKDGHHYQCKLCMNANNLEYRKAHKELSRKIANDYNHRHPDKYDARKHRARIKKYGITEEYFQSLLDFQNGVCAICGEPNPTCIDHNHETGEVRGLLCQDCNFAIGVMRDNPARFRNAATYLEAYPCNSGMQCRKSRDAKPEKSCDKMQRIDKTRTNECECQ